MSRTEAEATSLEVAEDTGGRKSKILSAGGMIGAILASTCCVLPLLFVSLGISGAWIGNLTALEPYKPYFAAVALIFIGLGLRQVYLKERLACVDGSYCAKPASTIITKAALWFSIVVVLLALSINWWAPLFY